MRVHCKPGDSGQKGILLATRNSVGSAGGPGPQGGLGGDILSVQQRFQAPSLRQKEEEYSLSSLLGG